MPVGVFPGYTSNAIWGSISGDITDQADLQAEILTAQGISSVADETVRLALTGLPYGYTVLQLDTGFEYKFIGAAGTESDAGSWVASPKVYVASISQTSTDAPTAVVIQNSLGGVPVWSRNGQGDYRLTLAGAFPLGKVVTPVSSYDGAFGVGGGSPLDNTSGFIQISADVLSFATIISSTANDDQLAGYPVKIEVYPV